MLQKCSACGTQVLPTEAGRCPACTELFAAADGQPESHRFLIRKGVWRYELGLLAMDETGVHYVQIQSSDLSQRSARWLVVALAIALASLLWGIVNWWAQGRFSMPPLLLCTFSALGTFGLVGVGLALVWPRWIGRKSADGQEKASPQHPIVQHALGWDDVDQVILRAGSHRLSVHTPDGPIRLGRLVVGPNGWHRDHRVALEQLQDACEGHAALELLP